MSEIHSISNKDRVKRSKSTKTNIKEILQALINKDVIKSFREEVSFGRAGFPYEKNYLANYIINTQNDKFIVVRSTTSFRSDRYKIAAYDIEGANSCSEYSNHIIASVLLLPTDEIKNGSFLSFRNRVYQKKQHSPFTHILVLEEFIDFLSTLETSVIEEFENDQSELFSNKTDINSSASRGSIFGKRGNAFVTELVEKINAKDVLDLYKRDHPDDAINTILDFICKKNFIDKSKLISIKASNSIKLLRTGGPCKTDFFIKAQINDGNYLLETFSAKFTDKTRVTCHEYNYERFVKVMDCKGTKLENYLRLFQKYGGYKELKANLPKDYTINEFVNLLKSKEKVLLEWALKGEHDFDQLVEPDFQVCKNLVFRASRKTICFSYNEYIKKAKNMQKSNTANFGTIFSWTFPSKRKGKKIQLKLPIFEK